MKSFFENRASIIGGAMIGLIVGTGPLLAVTFSLFIKPATEDLGWPRAAFSGAGLVASLVGIVAAPIFGWLVDSFGVKRACLPLIALSAVMYAVLSIIPGEVTSEPMP